MRLPLGPPPAKVNPAPYSARIPDDRACWCVDCRTYFHLSARCCPACGSEHFWPCWRWLTR